MDERLRGAAARRNQGDSEAAAELLRLQLRAGQLSRRDLAVAALMGCPLSQGELGWAPEETDLNMLVRLSVFVEPDGTFPGADEAIGIPPRPPLRLERKRYLLAITSLLLEDFPKSSVRDQLETVVADSSDDEDSAWGLGADLGNATRSLADEVGEPALRRLLASALLPRLLARTGA